jgi:putative ABC transport system permease protein
MATVLTLVLSLGILPQLPWLLGGILPEGIKPALSWQSAGIALLLGTLGNLLVCLPILHRLGSIQPSRLFQEGQGDGLPYTFDWKQLWTWIPASAAYWILAVQQAHSYRVGSLFIGIFLVALLIFSGFGLLLIKFLSATRKESGNLSLDLATLALVRHKTGTIASFVAIGMGTLLVNLIPAIKNIVASELERPQGKAPPSLFLIDIQEEQKDRLTQLVPTLTGGVGLENLSPLIRARLTAINGDTQKASGQNLDNSSSATREEEESERFVNRGYNLSYRMTRLASETITEGRYFSGEFTPETQDHKPPKIPEISVEERFAARLGLKLGDVMSFDIEGVQVDGSITSLRKVKWTSFDPNFFVIFQPGVLDAAPKTYIGTIPPLSIEVKTKTEMKLVREFPNISMIDLTATSVRILALAEQMSQALSLMALLTLVSGLAVLFAIAHHQAQKRVIEITLLKILGTDFGTIRFNVILEFAILGFAATFLGSLVGITASWVLASQVFESQWTRDILTPLALALGLGTTCTVTGFYAVNRILKVKPIVLLGNALFDK